jgi:hypothetical protein
LGGSENLTKKNALTDGHRPTAAECDELRNEF